MKRRILLAIVVCVLISSLLWAGCGSREKKLGANKKTAAKQVETTETAREVQTPEDKAITDLSAAKKETAETISEVEADIKDIQNIDTGQDNESGY